MKQAMGTNEFCNKHEKHDEGIGPSLWMNVLFPVNDKYQWYADHENMHAFTAHAPSTISLWIVCNHNPKINLKPNCNPNPTFLKKYRFPVQFCSLAIWFNDKNIPIHISCDCHGKLIVIHATSSSNESCKFE